MTPAEFLSRYGPITYRTVTIDGGGGSISILPNPNRYLIGFQSAAATTFYRMDSANTETANMRIVTEGTGTIFTYALHGALPTSGWRVVGTVGGEAITIIEGLMIPIIPTIRSTRREETVTKTKSRSRDSKFRPNTRTER